MSIAAREGAIVLCRSTRSTGSLREVGDQLEFLIKTRRASGESSVPLTPLLDRHRSSMEHLRQFTQDLIAS
jgi:hypothetical protein